MDIQTICRLTELIQMGITNQIIADGRHLLNKVTIKEIIIISQLMEIQKHCRNGAEYIKQTEKKLNPI